jgi:hypothetical protein
LHDGENNKLPVAYIDAQFAVLNLAYNTTPTHCESDAGTPQIAFALNQIRYHDNREWARDCMYGARFFDIILHSTMLLDPTHIRLKRTRV